MEKKKILVVDDEADICNILKFNLDNAGFDTTVAHSGEEALAIGIANFDLILLDIMMDKISGLQLAQQVRKKPETANIPIIFVTAKDTENDMVKGFNIGADDYISKPFSIREVITRVQAVLRRSSRDVAHSETVRTPRAGYGEESCRSRRRRNRSHQDRIGDSESSHQPSGNSFFTRRYPRKSLA